MSDKKLMLHTPMVKECHLEVSNARQKVTYLMLPDNYSENLLGNDIKNGATIYEPLASEVMDDGSNYTIISASNLEDGYRAVVYLASQKATLDGHAENVSEFDPSAIYEEGERFFDIDDLLDDDSSLVADDSCYIEDFSRIPIISSNAIVDYYESEPFMNTGFGQFSVEYRSPIRTVAPWWLDCDEESVCIVSDMNRPRSPFETPEAISEKLLNGISRFSSNRTVYVLVITDKPSKDDFSISRAMLEYAAGYCVLEGTKKELDDYHHRLMQEIASEYGLKFSTKIDSRSLASKLESIDKKSPCATFEKVMRYITLKSKSKNITPDTFDDFGLKAFVERGIANKVDMKAFDTLQGMDEVKAQFEKILNALRFNKKREASGYKALDYHKTFVFLGAPGTAKTTAAKMLTDIMASEELIPGNRFISVSGAQLKGAYVGQTAPRVHALFAEHDAIFIDEAYSLTSNESGEIDMYAQEALAQLAIELEEHSKDKLIIFAGYGGRMVTEEQNKMKQFIEANPGIKSRISTTVYFDSYSSNDMVAILRKQAELAGLKIEKGIDVKIAAYFFIRSTFDDFGNGREARVFLETCQQMMANRLMSGAIDLSCADMNLITKSDIEAAIKELSEKNRQDVKKKAIGFK